ncbi:hypothetical protein B0H11DRAFT_1933683 [Mycena galericulata]|nr:hypothetical protein B0H11DRAFT_1933683 [Mycena galericulata]
MEMDHNAVASRRALEEDNENVPAALAANAVDTRKCEKPTRTEFREHAVENRRQSKDRITALKFRFELIFPRLPFASGVCPRFAQSPDEEKSDPYPSIPMNRDFLDGATGVTGNLLQELNLRLESVTQSATEKGVAEITKRLIQELALLPAQIAVIAQDARKYAKTDEGEGAGMAWVVKTALEVARRGISQERELVALQASLNESEERYQALLTENEMLRADLGKKDLALETQARLEEREAEAKRWVEETTAELLQARVVMYEGGEENAALKMQSHVRAQRKIEDAYKHQDINEAHVALGVENKEKLRRARAELLKMPRLAIAGAHAVRPSSLRRVLSSSNDEPTRVQMVNKLGARRKIAVMARRRVRTEHAALQSTCRELRAQIKLLNRKSAGAAQVEFDAALTKLKLKYDERAKKGRRTVEGKLAELEAAKENSVGGEGIGHGKRKRSGDSDADADAEGDGATTASGVIDGRCLWAVGNIWGCEPSRGIGSETYNAQYALRAEIETQSRVERENPQSGTEIRWTWCGCVLSPFFVSRPRVEREKTWVPGYADDIGTTVGSARSRTGGGLICPTSWEDAGGTPHRRPVLPESSHVYAFRGGKSAQKVREKRDRVTYDATVSKLDSDRGDAKHEIIGLSTLRLNESGYGLVNEPHYSPAACRMSSDLGATRNAISIRSAVYIGG